MQRKNKLNEIIRSLGEKPGKKALSIALNIVKKGGRYGKKTNSLS